MGKVYNQKNQTGMRKALRKKLPKAEVMLWSRLKGKQLSSYKFRRQYGVGPCVIDFYCPELKLGIEVDGTSHFYPDKKDQDRKRQGFIESYGIHLIRYTNLDVYENLDGVIEDISRSVRSLEGS